MGDDMLIWIRVTPRAGRDALGGWREGAEGRRLLEVRVAAAPSDGDANAAVEALVAEAAALPRRAVKVERGASARIKQLRLSAPRERLAQAAVRLGIRV